MSEKESISSEKDKLITTEKPYDPSAANGYAHPPVYIPPQDYLYLSIFSIIFCFWPVGLVALIKSVEARKFYQDGLVSEGQASAAESKKYNKIAIIVGIILHAIGWILIVGSVVTQVALQS